jgi:hypothetical protein
MAGPNRTACIHSERTTGELTLRRRSAARSWPAGRLLDRKSQAPEEKMLVFFTYEGVSPVFLPTKIF